MAEIIQFHTFEVDGDMTQEEKDALVENIMQTIYGDDKNSDLEQKHYEEVAS